MHYLHTERHKGYTTTVVFASDFNEFISDATLTTIIDGTAIKVEGSVAVITLDDNTGTLNTNNTVLFDTQTAYESGQVIARPRS
jgi:hypothetical protein